MKSWIRCSIVWLTHHLRPKSIHCFISAFVWFYDMMTLTTALSCPLFFLPVSGVVAPSLLSLDCGPGRLPCVGLSWCECQDFRWCTVVHIQDPTGHVGDEVVSHSAAAWKTLQSSNNVNNKHFYTNNKVKSCLVCAAMLPRKLPSAWAPQQQWGLYRFFLFWFVF